jgi:exosortase
VGLAVLLLTAHLLWPVVDHAMTVWATDETLRFGFAAPLVTLVLVWWRRDALRRGMAEGRPLPLPLGLLLVLGGLGLLLLCQRLSAASPAAWSAGFLLWSIAVCLWGWRAGRVLAFPIGFLAFGLGLQPTLLAPLGFALQQLTAMGTEVVVSTLGLAVQREGLVLRIEAGAFIVAEACSGMSSLLALLGLASLWTYLAHVPWSRQLAILISALPLVVIANISRVSLVLLVAAQAGEEAALGFFHGASSLVLYTVALGGLLLVSKLLGCPIGGRSQGGRSRDVWAAP